VNSQNKHSSLAINFTILKELFCPELLLVVAPVHVLYEQRKYIYCKAKPRENKEPRVYDKVHWLCQRKVKRSQAEQEYRNEEHQKFAHELICAELLLILLCVRSQGLMVALKKLSVRIKKGGIKKNKKKKSKGNFFPLPVLDYS